MQLEQPGQVLVLLFLFYAGLTFSGVGTLRGV